jgi:hypothetical protein
MFDVTVIGQGSRPVSFAAGCVRALAINGKVLGPEHSGTAAIRDHLAIVLQDQATLPGRDCSSSTRWRSKRRW